MDEDEFNRSIEPILSKKGKVYTPEPDRDPNDINAHLKVMSVHCVESETAHGCDCQADLSTVNKYCNHLVHMKQAVGLVICSVNSWKSLPALQSIIYKHLPAASAGHYYYYYYYSKVIVCPLLVCSDRLALKMSSLSPPPLTASTKCG